MKWTSLLFLLSVFSWQAYAENKLVLNVQLNPAGSFQALSENIEGDLIKKQGVLSAEKLVVKIETLKTGIDLRDEHLWKHMSAAKYKKAFLTQLIGKDGVAKAILEVAGVKRPVQIKFQDDGKKINGTFKVSAHDFKLPEAEYMGIGVDDEVVAEVSMVYKQP